VEGQSGSGQQYVLGNQAEELARLDRQASFLERPTRLLLQAAGIGRGIRVLDLGTGLGHVARLAGELVGPTGSVTGIDQSADALSLARERTIAAGATHVSFNEADVCAWRAPDLFDAIVGRLVLFHCADPVAVVRHHVANLRRGGQFIAIDFDIGGSRTDPPVAVVDDALRWVLAAFRAAGAWPRIGARLGIILKDAGLERVTMFGIQPYVFPDDPSGAALLAGVVHSLAPAIIRHGIATPEELELATLEQRIGAAARKAGAVVLTPTLVGAWGYSASA
jgi:SAM-dependent methyltransferase